MRQAHKCEDLGARDWPFPFVLGQLLAGDGIWVNPFKQQPNWFNGCEAGGFTPRLNSGAGEKITPMSSESQLSLRPRESLRKKNQWFLSPQWQGGPSSSLWQEQLCHVRLPQSVGAAAQI